VNQLKKRPPSGLYAVRQDKRELERVKLISELPEPRAIERSAQQPVDPYASTVPIVITFERLTDLK
jgi:hypothetical protein